MLFPSSGNAYPDLMEMTVQGNNLVLSDCLPFFQPVFVSLFPPSPIYYQQVVPLVSVPQSQLPP
jgi:hypothetical protein